MCHTVRVKLTDAETKSARRLYGILAPIYASIALVVLAAVTLSSGSSRPGGDAAVAQAQAQALKSSPGGGYGAK